MKPTDLVMEEDIEAVHHVGRAGVIDYTLEVTQQEVETVLDLGTV